ncbi:EndoU domain-containing protein [Roseburia inulinivorans]|uniref:EndoU domain-containing protein n=1 Tax=Roseburia inulinivorans TaxID=360807 RepID=UPI001FAB12A9|nr:EndoU domain-containing protein [Roseburia inulinivorans]
MSDISYYYPRFYLGLPEGEKKELGEILSCDICFDGRYYAVSGRCTVDRKDFICYDVVTGTRLSLGDRVTYEGRELTVSRKKTELVRGEVIFTYRLAGSSYTWVPWEDNLDYTGMSFVGAIVGTQGEQVEVAFDIDQTAAGGNRYGFAPATGNLMYCMPQKGTKTSLYIGNGNEAQGIATGCIRTNGSTCEGTTIESNGGLVLMAKEGIRLESMTGIAMQGISASKYTGYPPYDDAPKEGEFDWEGFTRNLAIGLGVVAVCAIGAAISIATLGAGSILAGAFIGVGIGALSTTAMKAGEEISTGNVRSAKEALRDVGISAASGFITGAFGAKFPGAHRLAEGVVDTAVSAGERYLYAVFDDSMSREEKRAYAFDPGQMVADFVTGVVIGEFLDGIMAATQNKLRSIFANYDVTMREALETSYGKSTFNSLKNTENFTDSAIEHIFEGQVNARGKAVGYHYEGIEGTSSGGIEMKYRIEEYKLKNGIEDISIIFDEKYQLLTTFMSCDVLPFEKWIKSGFDRVLSGKSEYEEVNGNVCCAEISPKTTKVYDNLAEDAMGNWCEVDTKELRQLIDEWCDKVQKFKMSITTKPPHRQA